MHRSKVPTTSRNQEDLGVEHTVGREAVKTKGQSPIQGLTPSANSVGSLQPSIFFVFHSQSSEKLEFSNVINCTC